jgi:hypothetical protein
MGRKPCRKVGAVIGPCLHAIDRGLGRPTRHERQFSPLTFVPNRMRLTGWYADG